MSLHLSELDPELTSELRLGLRALGETALANQVDSLDVADRCRCGSDFCATMYVGPRPPKGKSYGPTHRNVHIPKAEGLLVLDVVDDRIVTLEVLFRDQLRVTLLNAFPDEVDVPPNRR